MSAAPGRPGEIARVVAVTTAAVGVVVTFLASDHPVVNLALLLVAVPGWLASRRWTAGPLDEPFGLFVTHRRPAVATLVLLMLAVPFFLRDSPYWQFVLVLAGIHAVMAIGLNLQVGSAEMVNLGIAGFAGIGAYVSATLAKFVGISPWFGLIAGGAASALVGVALGLPTAHTRGYYFSLVTIAFGIIVYLLIVNAPWIGGPSGLLGVPTFHALGTSFREPISLAGVVLPYQARYYYLVAIVLAMSAVAATRLYHSPGGLFWNALREDEIATRTLGIDVARAKLWAMAFGNFFAGAGGALFAHTVGFIAPDNFTFLHSVMLVSMVILGGMDNVPGVIAGAVVLTIVPEKFRAFQDYRLLFYGLVVVLMLHFRPQGLFPRTDRRYPLPPQVAARGTAVVVGNATTAD